MATFNPNSPAVRRLQTEYRQLLKASNPDFRVAPLEDNLFEWHFTLRGPPDTPFAQGLYHGRLLFPPEYPQKPPHFLLSTENGRFKVGVKICLSMSAYHPEEWQPSWSVESMLIALRAFMPTAAEGAIGGIDVSDERRRQLALKSHEYFCEHCGMVAADVLEEMQAAAGPAPCVPVPARADNASATPAAAAPAVMAQAAVAATPMAAAPATTQPAQPPQPTRPPQPARPAPEWPPVQMAPALAVASGNTAAPAVTAEPAAAVAAPDDAPGAVADAPGAVAHAAGVRRRRHPNEQPWERAQRKKAERHVRHESRRVDRLRSQLSLWIVCLLLLLVALLVLKLRPEWYSHAWAKLSSRS